MSRKKLILIPSGRMDSNKKEDRNEHGLIRMSKVVRNNMGFDKQVEVYPATESTNKRLKSTMLLDIFHAFSGDLKEARSSISSKDEIERVGFVTSRTFRKVTGSKTSTDSDIWITDGTSDTIIGADPEFVLFDGGNIIRANNVLSFTGQVGCDGAMAEVRPKPAIRPEELVRNIKTLLENEEMTKDIQEYDWVAGCYFKDSVRDYPVGGHIHIGNPVQIARLDLRIREDFFKSFNKILDELLAVPMIKVDGAALGRARRVECTMQKYGYFGECRTSNGRLEHRTLSGMWLMHPTLATLVFGVAKAIIEEVYKLVFDRNLDTDYMFPKKFRKESIWSASFEQWGNIPIARDMGCGTNSRDLIELLHKSSSSKITSKFLKSWYGHMRGLSTYKTYSKYIDGLYEVLKNSTKTFRDYDKDIKNNWLGNAKFLD